MNGELQVNQAQRVTELLSREGIEKWSNNAIDVLDAHSRDSGSLPCNIPSKISLRNILNSAPVLQVLPRVTTAYKFKRQSNKRKKGLKYHTFDAT